MYISIDIGGTHTRIADSTTLNNIKIIHKNTLNTNHNFKKGITKIINQIKHFFPQPKAIGIGIAGKIDKNGKKLIRSTNLSDWTNKPITKILEKEFDCQIYLKNDAVAQSLGEKYYGSKLKKDFLYLVWGTGFGGALILQNNHTFKSIKIKRLYLRKWEKNSVGKILK